MEITEESKNTKVKPIKVKHPWRDLYSEAFSNRLCNSYATIWRTVYRLFGNLSFRFPKLIN